MTLSLDQLPHGTHAFVTNLCGDAAICQRLAEFGMVPGARVSITRCAPLGDPLEVDVEGCALSVRKTEAALIHVTMGDEV